VYAGSPLAMGASQRRRRSQQRWWVKLCGHRLIVPAVGHPRERDQAELLGHPPSAPRQFPIRPLPALSASIPAHCQQPLPQNHLRRLSPQASSERLLRHSTFIWSAYGRRQERRRRPLARRSGLSLRMTPTRVWKQAAGRPIPDVFKPDGEAGFRELEPPLLARFSAWHRCCAPRRRLVFATRELGPAAKTGVGGLLGCTVAPWCSKRLERRSTPRP